jgi:hypothetical protein
VFTSGALASAASNTFDLSAGPAVAIGYRGTPPRLRSGIASGSAGGASGVAAQLLDSEGNDAALSGRAVTVPVVGGASSQCADSARIARGRGSAANSRAKSAPATRSSANVGAPCETNTTGMRPAVGAAGGGWSGGGVGFGILRVPR